MITALGTFLGTLTTPLTAMGTSMGYNMTTFGTMTGGAYASQPMSTVAFSVFGSSWVAASGPIVVGLSTFLGEVVAFLNALTALL